LTINPAAAIGSQPFSTLAWTYFFGVLWGFGGLTFGLAMRYLGMSLGMGVALGYCAAFGTLLPPILKTFMPDIPVAETIGQIAATFPGKITLLGVGVCLLGIWVAALAGANKEKEMPSEEKLKTIKEFDFKKGLLVATFSGVMSACFSFGLTAGEPIGKASVALGTDELWSGLPSLIVVMLGGFTTNFIWCVLLNIKNKTGYQYLATQATPEHAGLVAAGGDHGGGGGAPVVIDKSDLRIPRLSNYIFSALAGSIWYFQFFFYSMGHIRMGGSNVDGFGFSSWTLHMASIIVFSTMWGWIFHEWKGSSKKTYTLIVLGILTLIISTIIIGYGTYLKGVPAAGH
jgi:L-rhamnose-H+ transport protein